jgi:hypothetical protein
MKGLFSFWQMKNGRNSQNYCFNVNAQKFTSVFATVMNNTSSTISFNKKSLSLSKCWCTDFFFPKFTSGLSAENELKLSQLGQMLNTIFQTLLH